MIKNIVISLLAVVVMDSCTKTVKNEYTITGSLDTLINGMVYLQKRLQGPLITIDSAQVSKGNFRLKGTIDYPEVYYLTLPATKSSVPFFIEPSEIIVNINTKNINKTKITGSKNQAAYDGYLDMVDQFNAKLKESYQMYNKAEELGDLEKVRHYDSLITVLDEQRSQFSKNYVLQNTQSFVSPYIMYRNSYTYELEDLEKALNALDTSLSHSVYTGFLTEYLATLKRTAVGQMYVPFSMQDSTGMMVSLSDLTGRNYLLVDFWASWCAPCREENPNLVRLYNKYHDRGFDIFGVSFDSNRERWLEAIAADSLTWTHVSDLQGWENKAGKLYGIRSIPSNVLLDTTGMIISKNLRGDDLRIKLEELFPAPAKVKK
ncbi:MAG: AhpC/TSA family protein [Bacteroidales bacterium]|jgi:peroxiredoxin|nr:AhpC/TSA family protein [Bacteroidales bacterium]